MYVFFQAEDGIRDLVRSRGLGDVYKRQAIHHCYLPQSRFSEDLDFTSLDKSLKPESVMSIFCLLYTSDAADERSSVDLGGRRIITNKTRGANRIRKRTTDKTKKSIQ